MIGGVRLSSPASVYMRAAARLMSPGAASSVSPMILSAANACCISLALWVLSWMARSLSTGSSKWVASDANIAPTFVPTPVSSPSTRNETGTCAMSGISGNSPPFSR